MPTNGKQKYYRPTMRLRYEDVGGTRMLTQKNEIWEEGGIIDQYGSYTAMINTGRTIWLPVEDKYDNS